MSLPAKNQVQIDENNIVIDKFVQAVDGAWAGTTFLTGQTRIDANGPTIVSNQLSLGTTASVGLTYYSNEVFIRAKLVSATGSTIFLRKVDASNYWYVASLAAGTRIAKVVAGVETILATITGAAANDIVTANFQDNVLSVVRNNNIIYEVYDNANYAGVIHGLMSKAVAGTVLFDNLLIMPVI